MKDDIEQIAQVFLRSRWKSSLLSHDMEKAGLSSIFVCGYAAVGVVLANSVSSIKSSWTDCQLCMSDLRENKDIGLKKDLYLLFIIPEIDVLELKDLQPIINDTHICRKICLERKGRVLEEALMDTPFLKLVERQKTEIKTSDPATVVSEYGMPHNLLKDLSNRSPEAILDRILEGKYKKVKSDEN